MKRTTMVVFIIGFFVSSGAHAGLLEKVQEFRDRNLRSGSDLDADTVASGLKEALSIGAKNGIKEVSQVDGYFGNQMIKIMMPEKIRKTEKALRKIGLGKEADKFILSMNRAAEKAAPQALSMFRDAIREMTIHDAMKILKGNDTAATDYLKSKTFDRLYQSFMPVISASMNEVGVTQTFKHMMDKARSVPFLKKETVDLDQYVTGKALDGLFLMVGREEQKIRTNPSARVTELLKTVFRR